jgi:hypothetical protein
MVGSPAGAAMALKRINALPEFIQLALRFVFYVFVFFHDSEIFLQTARRKIA